jgi:hypothetical protein
MDPVSKRIVRLRTLVAIMLAVAAVAVGLGSYLGLSFSERNAAEYRFTSTVEAAISKLDDNFKKMEYSMSLMAQVCCLLIPFYYSITVF